MDTAFFRMLRVSCDFDEAEECNPSHTIVCVCLCGNNSMLVENGWYSQEDK